MTAPKTLADLLPLAERRRDEHLTAGEVALYLGVRVSTIEKWRRPSTGRPAGGPPYLTLGDGPKAPVRYPAGDVQDWLASRRRGNGGGQPPAQAA